MSHSFLIKNNKLVRTCFNNYLPLITGGGRLRRGRTLFFQDHEKEATRRGMVLELTPQKGHIKVATTSREKPVVIGLDEVREQPPQPLDGKVFVVSGNILERGEKRKVNTDELSKLILKNGGSVYTGNMEKAVDADFILITSQKEVDKEHPKMNRAIAFAYQYGWPIISKKFVIDADCNKVTPDLNNYRLDLAKMNAAPESALAKVPLVKRNSVVDTSKRFSAHQEMKKKIRQKVQKRTEHSQNENTEKKTPKRACSGYVAYSKELFASVKAEDPKRTFKEINLIIAQKWKSMPDGDKKDYALKGKENFENRQKNWNASISHRS